jgi:hypothetical protein
VKKHKITNRTKKKIETRVQRSVVLEDGKIIADTGPQAISRTFEVQDNENVDNERGRGDFPSEESDSDCDTNEEDEQIFEDDFTSYRNRRRTIKDDFGDKSSGNKHVSLKKLPIVRRVSNIKRSNKKASREVSHFHHESLRDIMDPEEVERARQTPADFLDKMKNEFPTSLPLQDQSGQLCDQLSEHKLRFYSLKSNNVKEKEKIKQVSRIDPNGVITTDVTRSHAVEEVCDEEVPEAYSHRMVDYCDDSLNIYKEDDNKRSRSLTFGDFYFGFNERMSSPKTFPREVCSEWESPHYPARSDWKTVQVIVDGNNNKNRGKNFATIIK